MENQKRKGDVGVGYNEIVELVVAKFGHEDIIEIAFAIDKRRAWHRARNRFEDVEFWNQVMIQEYGPRYDAIFPPG